MGEGMLSISKPMLPIRILNNIGNGCKSVMGPLITSEFWVKVVALCAKEMIAAFMKTLGGKFLSYGVSREDPEIKKTAQQVNPASSAFSSGYTPRPEYPRSDFSTSRNEYTGYNRYPAPVPSTPSTGGNFPGFGK